jgi:methionine biosynthesis protein MetW
VSEELKVSPSAPHRATSPDQNASGLVREPVDPLRYDWRLNTDPDEVAGIVAKMIPAGSRLLDIGCGTGSLSRLLADECGAEVVGVEPDVERAAKASSRGVKVLRGYLSAQMIRDAGTFDVALMADVLEHLPSPQEILLLAREALKPRGSVIVSVPNVAHWSVRLCLARGKFEYQPWGIMDATHLRWFTAESARALLASAGLTVVEYRATAGVDLLENYGRVPLRWLSARQRARFLHTACRRWPTLFGAQHVLKAEMR